MDPRLEQHRNCAGLCSAPRHTAGVQGLAREEQGRWSWRHSLHTAGKSGSGAPRGALPLSPTSSSTPRERQHRAQQPPCSQSRAERVERVATRVMSLSGRGEPSVRNSRGAV